MLASGRSNNPSMSSQFESNHRVQATPDYALLLIVAQVSGAPDATSRGKL
jgi:hypothetical protein